MTLLARAGLKAPTSRSSDFPIQNLPFGVFQGVAGARIGVAIGDQVLDVLAALQVGLLDGEAGDAARLATGGSLNALMGSGNRNSIRVARAPVRSSVAGRAPCDANAPDRRQAACSDRECRDEAACEDRKFHRFSDVDLSYGTRWTRDSPDNPVPPAFKYLPIAYNGRATSVRLSGEPVRRPNVQWRNSDGKVEFGPCRQLDFELEVGVYVGRGNALGEPISIEDAPDHIFGLCLLNDWSARDIQRWESVLGPFLAKAFQPPSRRGWSPRRLWRRSALPPFLARRATPRLFPI